MEEDKIRSYFEFDDAAQEVVFHRYDMPSPWMNYLTNETFYTMMSQAGGSLSWYKSPAIWRIGRYPFFNLPTDCGGLFLYIKDLKTGTTWCPNGLPCHCQLDSFESRHGLGYTKFISCKDGVKAELLCFVGEKNALIYRLKLSCAEPRELKLFLAKEMGNMEYLREAVWQCYTRQSNDIRYRKNVDALVYDYFIDMQPRPSETPFVFLTSTLPSSSFTGSRKDFLGYYRDFSNPKSVELGVCPNTELQGGEGTMAFSYDVSLKGEMTCGFALGTIEQNEDQDACIADFKKLDHLESMWIRLREKWKQKQARFHVETPDPDLNRMANVWNPYQAYVNFLVCRNISYYAPGVGRGFGVRDTSQDCLSQVLHDPKAVIARIQEVMQEQYRCGKTNHTYFHVEKEKSVVSDRSDDHLWMIYTLYEVAAETGDLSFLDQKVPFYDGGEATMLEHLEASLSFTLSTMGQHHIPLMLNSDWNDCLNTVCRKGKGESVMVAEQFVLGARMVAELRERKGLDGSRYRQLAKQQADVLNQSMWEDDHYIRAITDSGVRIGGSKEECARIWLNSNSWAVISETADTKRGNEAMDQVMKYCNTDIGLVMQYPALKRNYPSPEEEISFATPGIGENGGIFCHANAWAIIAYCLLGRGDDAYRVYSELMPYHIVKKLGVERYNAEPYIYSSNVRAPYAERGGEAGVSWLSGTATWMNIALQHYIFGCRPKFDALEIEPCLPSSIRKAKIQRIFQGCLYDIEVENLGNTKEQEIYVDGKRADSCLIKPKGQKLKIKVICR